MKLTIFKLRLGAFISWLVCGSVGRSVGLQNKIGNRFALSSKQNIAINMSVLSSKQNCLHKIKAKLTLALSSNRRPKYQIKYNSTHRPSLHAQLEAIERKLAKRSNQRPKYKKYKSTH